jgi:hypothetical protein
MHAHVELARCRDHEFYAKRRSPSTHFSVHHAVRLLSGICCLNHFLGDAADQPCQFRESLTALKKTAEN